jgi:hypothetical protein
MSIDQPLAGVPDFVEDDPPAGFASVEVDFESVVLVVFVVVAVSPVFVSPVFFVSPEPAESDVEPPPPSELDDSLLAPAFDEPRLSVL